LTALGAWDAMAEVLEDLHHHGVYANELAGQYEAVRRAWRLQETDGRVAWRNWRLLAPVDEVRQSLASEPKVHLTFIHTSSDCAVGGEANGCRRVIESLGCRAIPLDYDLAIHTPEVREIDALWRAIHR